MFRVNVLIGVFHKLLILIRPLSIVISLAVTKRLLEDIINHYFLIRYTFVELSKSHPETRWTGTDVTDHAEKN